MPLTEYEQQCIANEQAVTTLLIHARHDSGICEWCLAAWPCPTAASAHRTLGTETDA